MSDELIAGERLLVCGSRDYTDRDHVFRVLDDFLSETPIACVIHGAYRGVDTLADDWAKARGIKPEPFPADWNSYGPGAGPIRNQQMIDEGKPTFAIVFPGGHGTANMMLKLERHSIPFRKARALDPAGGE